MRKLNSLVVIAILLGMSIPVCAGTHFGDYFEDFDALGAAAGEFGLDDATSDWWAGEDDPALATGAKPPTCDPAQGGDHGNGCATNQTRLVDLGGGDWAMYHVNWAFAGPENRGSSGILSRGTWTRGNKRGAIANIFGDPGLAPAGEACPKTCSPFGLWYKGASPGQGWGTALPAAQNNWPEKNVELGVSFWAGWKWHFEEGGGGQIDTSGILGLDRGPAQDQGLHGWLIKDAVRPGGDAIQPPGSSYADQKALSGYWWRSELGDTTGGVQYVCEDYTLATNTCNDPGGWYQLTSQSPLDVPIDTRGMPANMDGPGGTSTVGDSAMVHLGLGAFKHLMADNIVVYNDLNPVPVELSNWLID